MNEKNLNPDDAKLRSLLRESSPAPTLPPRFQENVWKRIEKAETKSDIHWLDVMASWLARPRLAFAAAAVLVVVGVGVGLGWNSAERQGHNDAQARYLAAVAPNAFH